MHARTYTPLFTHPPAPVRLKRNDIIFAFYMLYARCTGQTVVARCTAPRTALVLPAARVAFPVQFCVCAKSNYTPKRECACVHAAYGGLAAAAARVRTQIAAGYHNPIIRACAAT